jgi:hypothetical protein
MARAADTVTFEDIVSHLSDYIGRLNSQGDALRDAKRSVLSAYRELTNDHRWNYLMQQGRIDLVAGQTTGTITYDHTGGSSERLVTLSGATWPTWAVYGVLLISDVRYPIEERLSDTTVTLGPELNPGADVASGTSYTVFRDTYTLPPDYVNSGLIIDENRFGRLQYISIDSYQTRWRFTPATSNVPLFYTITGDPNVYGCMAMRFYSMPNAAETLDFFYERRPRSLKTHAYTTGHVATTADSTTITGDGTVWNDDHVGAIIRFSADDDDFPTGVEGGNPFLYERTVMSRASATSLTVDLSIPTSNTKLKYSISDPIDIEYGAMYTAFLRCCEKQVATIRMMDNLPRVQQAYDMAIMKAKETDHRVRERRTATGPDEIWGLDDYYRALPQGADVS